jgi:hypothetical protein
LKNCAGPALRKKYLDEIRGTGYPVPLIFSPHVARELGNLWELKIRADLAAHRFPLTALT